MTQTVKEEVVETHGTCPQCGSTLLIEDDRSGEIACPVCGYVIQKKGVDLGSEWRSFRGEETVRRRTGPPQSVIYRDMSTVISRPHSSAEGKRLPKKAKERVRRLRKLDYMVKSDVGKTRNLRRARDVLGIYGYRLHLPTFVMARAMEIYRRALDKDLVRGRAIRNIMAAAVYAACRLTNTPRDLKEFEKAYHAVKKYVVARDYRLLVKELKLKPPFARPEIHVNKIASRLGLDPRTIDKVLELLNEAREAGLTYGKGPVGIAAAALYLICKESHPEISQRDIAKAAGVTEVTIRNRSKQMEEQLRPRLEHAQIQSSTEETCAGEK